MAVRQKKWRILAVDDSPETLEMVERKLMAAGFRVYTAAGVVQAVGFLEQTPVDLVLTDLRMPGTSGLDLVRYVRENLPDSEVMMFTGYATVAGAVEAVKTGAEEYLAKPFTGLELLGAVRKVIQKLAIRRARTTQSLLPQLAIPGLIGESPRIRQVYAAIKKAATSLATVLIMGESGTGKELVARSIHYLSSRATAPFVPVNCGAIPADLLESELFGYVRGAFTGADNTRQGFFQTAHGGTVFLDEVAETSLPMQVKLLRVLQDKQVCMVGSRVLKTVDIRIIAATNQDLRAAVERGEFREDLFYRLHVINIDLPPLRERDNDVLLLVRHFAEIHAAEYERDPPEFTDAALRAFLSYDWPGNVRELENTIQRMIVMEDHDLFDVVDLPSHLRFSLSSHTGVQRTLAEVEREHVLNVLSSVDGNKTRAAEILGIDRKTLRKRLQQIEPDSSS
ncbi:MAG: sigma-54 dependent transcriptional regulator [bacterium]